MEINIISLQKLKNMSEEKVIEYDVRDAITEHMKLIERNWNWLSGKTDIPYATLYSIFVQRNFNPSPEKVALINKVLGTDFK